MHGPIAGELPQDEAGDDANGDQDATKRKDSLVAPLKASTLVPSSPHYVLCSM